MGKTFKKRVQGGAGGRGGGARRHLTDAAAPAAAAALRDEEESEEEEEGGDGVAPLGRRTRNAALQAKLDALCALAAAGRVRDFCAAFVPLDLSAADAADFAAGLEANPERWEVMAAELRVLATGDGVRKVLGDQTTRCEFHYAMPGRGFINREVVFTCVGGEWRAEG